MHKQLLIALVFLAATTAATAQYAPHTYLSSIVSASNGPLDVAVTVWDFDTIGAVYLSIDYDSRVLLFTGATPHSSMPTFLSGDADLGDWTHRITLGWYGNGLTLPDNSTIMTLHFNFLEGYSALTFYDNGPSCEYANSDGQVLIDTPYSEYYHNGEVCGSLPNPGPIFGQTDVCQQDNWIAYWVEPVANASGYYWEQTPNMEILSGQYTNLILVHFDNYATPVSLMMYVTNSCGETSSPAFLEVTVHETPPAYIEAIPPVPYGTSTTLHCSNPGSGSYSYHWMPEEIFINPDIQDPVTVNLYQDYIVKVDVVDLATGCKTLRQKSMNISGGPLAINPTASDTIVCSNSGTWVYSLASGGTGNYAYSWTSNPPGFESDLEDFLLVEPDTSRTYIVTVNDGASSVTDSTVVYVETAPTAEISGLDTLCGMDDVAYLRVDLTGTPPWNFTYIWGTRSEYVEGVTETPFYIPVSEPGTYSIGYVHSSLCEGYGYGTASVSQYPIPPAPVVTLYDNTLVSNIPTGNQWYRDGVPIPGAMAVSYTVTETGTYYDIIQRYGCTGEPSNSFYIVIEGMEEQGGLEAGGQGGVEVWPNPAENWINCRLSNVKDQLSNSSRNAEFEIRNLFGKQVLGGRLQVAGNEFSIDISALPGGYYVLVLTEDGKPLARQGLIKF